jgi:branched-subunit amino acid ABC-type transport system permease component
MDVVVNGVLGGGALGLAALGVSLSWWLGGQFNLAQASIVLVGAYAGWLSAGVVSTPGSVVVAAAAGALVGWAVEFLVLRRVAGRSVPVGLLLSFGCALAIVAAIQAVETDDYRSIAPGLGPGPATSGVAVSPADLVAAVAALALGAGLAWLRDRRPTGVVLRAIAEDPDAARLCGVRVTRVVAAVGACSGAFAGLAGWAIGSAGAFSTSDADRLLLVVSVVAVVGGAGRITRTLAAGFALGGLAAGIGEVASPRLVEVAALVVLLVALAGVPPRREASTSRLRGRPQP